LKQVHSKLHHKTPGWVSDGAVFHIRIRIDASSPAPLTIPDLAAKLLGSVRFYDEQGRWYAHLVLLMPDHLHGLLSFDLRSESMARVVGDWKRYHALRDGVRWQDGFFDHRMRNCDEFDEKASYIRMNPVRGQLCQTPEAWPFVLDRRTLDQT